MKVSEIAIKAVIFFSNFLFVASVCRLGMGMHTVKINIILIVDTKCEIGEITFQCLERWNVCPYSKGPSPFVMLGFRYFMSFFLSFTQRSSSDLLNAIVDIN